MVVGGKAAAMRNFGGSSGNFYLGICRHPHCKLRLSSFLFSIIDISIFLLDIGQIFTETRYVVCGNLG